MSLQTGAQPQPPDRPDVNDNQLVRAIAQGNQASLERLYDRYGGLVYSVALRVLANRADAEEILQDTFVQLWRKAAQFDAERGSLSAWLLVMARNRAISLLRRKDPLRDADADDTRVESSYQPENFLIGRELLGKIRKAMEDLPAAQRAAIEMGYFEGLSQSEIARRTGDPLGTIKTRMRSALQALREGCGF